MYQYLNRLPGLQIRIDPSELDWPACKEIGKTARIHHVVIRPQDKLPAEIDLWAVTEPTGYIIIIAGFNTPTLVNYLCEHDTGAVKKVPDIWISKLIDDLV